MTRGKFEILVCVGQFSVHFRVDSLVRVPCDQDVKECCGLRFRFQT